MNQPHELLEQLEAQLSVMKPSLTPILLKRAYECIRTLSSQPAPQQEIVEAANDLLVSADRVWRKYGHDEAGIPSDWTEWQNVAADVARLRAALHGGA